MRDAVIIDVVRLASGKGKPGGALSHHHPATMLSHVLSALVDRTGIDPGRVDDVITGCVQQIGEQSLNIARAGVLGAGFPESVPATTVDRQCGSSQQAAAFAAQGIIAGAYDVAIVAGVESMTKVPVGAAPNGQDPYGPQVAARYPGGLIGQGVSAELVSHDYSLTREELDEYAARSHQLAAENTESGFFASEIVGITAHDGTEHVVDETIRGTTTAEGLAKLRPSFHDEAMAARFPEAPWNITPGNSSPLTDGASAALIVEASVAESLSLTPRARFHSFAVAGDDPIRMLTAPIPASRKVIERSGLSLDDIAAYEVNEAFACVPLAWAKALGADPEKLNPRGGAIALGHALGSSGVRLMGTLVNHLESSGGRYGLQTMCEAGGLANATIIERL